MIEFMTMVSAVLVLVSGAALGTSPPPHATPADLSAELRLIDQGVEDVGLLGVGRVDLSADLGVSLDFGQVYELPPGPDGRRRFARRRGGVWAVFTRSDYVMTREGELAVVPPDTVFHLGAPPGLAPEPEPAPSPHRVSAPLDLRARPEPPPRVEVAPNETPESMLTDESYRVRRLRALMDAAIAGQG